MKNKTRYFLFLLLFSANAFPDDMQSSVDYFIEKHHKDIDYAIELLSDNFELIENESQLLNADTAMLLAVGFPELIRYSALKDLVETAGLKLLYTNLGDKYADFSIGLFQMKPSFAEKIEKSTIKLNSENEYNCYKTMAYDSTLSPAEIRAERVYRLEDTGWQIRYLYTMKKIVENREEYSNLTNYIDKIKYLSAVYNGGINLDEEDIVSLYTKKWFPYGPNSNQEQVNYQELAVFSYILLSERFDL